MTVCKHDPAMLCTPGDACSWHAATALAQQGWPQRSLHALLTLHKALHFSNDPEASRAGLSN